MRHVRFDIQTYNRTTGLSGSPLICVVEEEIPEIEMISDADGKPTRGGYIGYYLAYILMAAFLVYLFWAI